MGKDIVKARERHGTPSLDLTLPSNIRNKYKIKGGDVFKVESFEKNGDLRIVYTLVYKNE